MIRTESEVLSHRTILRSTYIIGGTQVFCVLAGIVRTKFLAVLLGPIGVGTAALYQAIVAVVAILVGLGISQSGVRQIAESASAGEDNKQISLSVFVVRRLSLVSGILGMILMMFLCWPIGKLSFGNTGHTFDIFLISLMLLFNTVLSGQMALLQGLRRIKDLAACQLFGALINTVVSIGIVWLLREKGIALYLVVGSAFSALASWWYARRIRISVHAWGRGDVIQESQHLLGMGLAFMVSGLAKAGAIYLMRIMISKSLGGFALGLYSAATALSVVYVDIIFTAMAADYYPRLTSVAEDDTRLNRMVNEQTEMGLLIGVPGLLLVLVLAPMALSIFYSRQFLPAADIIRWQILGVVFRLISFPLGYVQPAKGLKKIFMIGEVVFALLNVLLLRVCIQVWGYEGMGIAFAILYVLHVMFVFLVCRLLTGFRWEKRILLTILSSVAVAILVALLVRILPGRLGEGVGLVVALAAFALCVRRLNTLTEGFLQRKLMSLLRKGTP